MRIPGPPVHYLAAGAIGAYRIVKLTTDDTVAQAAAATDALLGVTDLVTADAAGERLDVYRSGICEVEYGGTVTRGQPLTSDADGKAVAASRAALVQTALAGGAAGAHTVPGITTADTLVSVIQIDATDATETVADLTAEFSISAANTISNTGGTATTGSRLLVTYRRPAVRTIGYAEVSGVAGDVGSVHVLPGQI